VISRTAMLVFEGVPAGLLGGLLWRFARRAQAGRRRRLRLLEMELRLASASEAFHQEVLRLRHYRPLRSNVVRRNSGLILSTNVSSLRYIKGRQNED
jgi:hypothetical protein